MQGEDGRAIVKVPFKGAPDGQVYPVKFKEGEYLWGDLAAAAVAAGQAVWASPKMENKAETPPEKKTGGLTGEAEPSSSQPVAQAKTKRTYKRRAKKQSSS